MPGVWVSRDDLGRDNARRAQEFEHAGLSLRRVVRIVCRPARPCPSPQDKAVDAATAVDDVECVVDVPGTRPQPPRRRNAAPAANDGRHPAQRRIGYHHIIVAQAAFTGRRP
jgi:hypothetical protein